MTRKIVIYSVRSSIFTFVKSYCNVQVVNESFTSLEAVLPTNSDHVKFLIDYLLITRTDFDIKNN